MSDAVRRVRPPPTPRREEVRPVEVYPRFVVTWWQTLAITLGASAIAVAGTLMATLLQLRQDDRKRLDLATRARRTRVAMILGPTRNLLSDALPERIGVNVDAATTPALLAELNQRWASLRDELSIFAAEDESSEVTEAAAELEVAVTSLLNRVAWQAHDLLDRRGRSLDTYHDAKREWLRATALLRIVLDLVRERDVAQLRATLGQIPAEGPVE